jgi:hypothetical protein
MRFFGAALPARAALLRLVNPRIRVRNSLVEIANASVNLPVSSSTLGIRFRTNSQRASVLTGHIIMTARTVVR